ncbi:hypothetical protein RJT12_13825 [Segatella copri]|uniref:hypothetical protein n=1 Tax=Segatella copri TaxID=165179 RepID=UPI00294B5A67|nr:hypothetical protein [Segatella copri]WOF96492.1 hypothetical protein RJT12_13825 [Segatella copri]
MKNKILFGIMAFVMSIFFAGCSDDDYSPSTTPLLDENSVVTGSADVTASSAIFHGTVKGLESQSSGSYTVGFMYGDAEDNLSEKVTGESTSEFSASISGTPGQVVYYQAFVTLQGHVTYTGTVSSAVLTDSKAITGEVKDLTATTVTFQASLEKAPADAVSGIILSPDTKTEKIRKGVRIQADGINDNYEVKTEGLLPNTTYHYTAYLDLGNGVVYGEEREFTTPESNFDPDNDLVDLGLSTKWARYNVGATSETELGGLFGFGDMTGFKTSVLMEDYASEDIYKTDRDVANKAYGSWLTMPTVEEFEELFNECKKEWVEQAGVAGYKLTGPNGNSIFLPAAGSRTQQTVSGQGINGLYLSGSINPADKQFALGYSFDRNSDRRTSTPVYQALAIRPVSVAKNVKFVKEKLYNTWEFDLKPDESHYKFVGPVFFYNKDACWASYTNNQPVVGETTGWDADYASIKSWCITDPNHCNGTMTFYKDEDGNDKVKVHQVQADGSYKDSEGTFTVDEKNKTITMTIDPLNAVEYIGGITRTDETKIKVMSLSDEALQLGVIRSADGQLMIYNYVTSDVKNGYPVEFRCAGEEGDWTIVPSVVKGGSKAVGDYTVTFNASTPHKNAQVVYLDIVGFSEKYPKALVRINSIKADGKEVKFDANKFHYGDIEGNGKYRVELFNIYGSGTSVNSPFRKEGGGNNEPALDFNETLEVSYSVVSTTSDGTGVYTPTFNTVRGWGEGEAQLWGYNDGSTLKVVKSDKGQYSLENNQFDMTYEGSGFDGGTIMTFIEFADLYGFFPGTHSTLDEFYLDGKAISYDKSKVIDANENPKYRLELFNCYGATKDNCAFGVKEGDLMRELGFNKSMRAKFTVHSLFPVPQW